MELKSVLPRTETSLEAGSASTRVPGRPVSMAFLIVPAQWPQVMSSTRRVRTAGSCSMVWVDWD